MLSIQPCLSDAEADRLADILKLAETDGLLDFWIHEVDHLLAHELKLTDAQNLQRLEDQQAQLLERLECDPESSTLKELLREVGQRLRVGSKELQQHLCNRGFDPGPVDGVFGPRTRAALTQFQEAKQVGLSGIVDAETREALGLS